MLEQEFSRNTFVKGGGALIVGFSVVGGALAGVTGAESAQFMKLARRMIENLERDDPAE